MSAPDVIEAFYAAYNRADASAATALHAPDAVHEEAASGKSRQGLAAIEQGTAGFLSMLEGLRLAPATRITAGPKVVVTYVMTGRMTRPIGPFEAHGQVITLEGAHVFHLEDGKIRKLTDYWSPEAFMAQIRAEHASA
ncbi:nuclear transport factor 2 family protein [Thioclava sp. GXIMD2076]|uniref:nuclear transport factor 2 family protein n=1 Tax=unclassified Thioclava TaxID=2621713 RepID=UPI0030D4DF11